MPIDPNETPTDAEDRLGGQAPAPSTSPPTAPRARVAPGVPTLLLTTLGRKSGKPRRTPLIYGATATTTWSWPPTAARPTTRTGTSTSRPIRT